MVCLLARLTLIIQIRKSCKLTDFSPSQAFKKRIECFLDRYRSILAKHSISDTSLNIICKDELFGIDKILDAPPCITFKDLLAAYELTKYALHGRNRLNLRLNISQGIRRRQLLYESGRTGPVIASILNSHRKGCELKYITLEDNSVMNSPEDIHNTTTNFSVNGLRMKNLLLHI